MHLARRSKSVRTKIKSGTCECDSCGIVTEYFVAILHSEKPASYHMVCLDCYERDIWETRISKKVAIMKGGSASDSKTKRSKQRKSHSQDLSVENTQETSTSLHWWDEI